jgi:hypothetical protein
MSRTHTAIAAHAFAAEAVNSAKLHGALFERPEFVSNAKFRFLVLCLFLRHLHGTPCRCTVLCNADRYYFTQYSTHIPSQTMSQLVTGQAPLTQYSAFDSGCMLVRTSTAILLCFLFKDPYTRVTAAMDALEDGSGYVNSSLLTVAQRIRPRLMSGLQLLQARGTKLPVIVTGAGLGGSLALVTLASIPKQFSQQLLINEVVLFGAAPFGDRDATRKIDSLVTGVDANIVLGSDPNARRFRRAGYAPLSTRTLHLVRRELQQTPAEPFLPVKTSRPRLLWETVRRAASAVWHGRPLDGQQDADLNAYVLALSGVTDLFVSRAVRPHASANAAAAVGGADSGRCAAVVEYEDL